MKKRICISVLLILIFTSILLYFYLKPRTIKVGFIAGLSGRSSQLGVNGRNALIMALDEINSRSGFLGRKVELIIKDNKSEPALINRAMNELIDEGVIAVIGPYTSNMADNVLKSIKDKNILVLSPTISTDKVSGIDDNFFRLIESAANQGQILAQKIIADKYQKLAVVYDHRNADYTKAVYDRIGSVLSEKNLEIIYSSEMPIINGRVDFVRIAQEIKKSGADSLAIISSSIDAANLIQQLRKLDSSIQIYGSRWAKSGHIIRDGGRAVEGMILVSNYSEKRKSGKFKKFMADYKNIYGEDANFPQIYTYDAIYLLKQAIEEADSIDVKKIKEAIIYISRFQGLDAVVEINKFGDAWRPYAMVKISNGVFKDID